jgi:uncharacterized protein
MELERVGSEPEGEMVTSGERTGGTALRMSRDEARGVMLEAQGLNTAPARRKVGIAAVREVIERLGVVQIDTISVVERSQYLVLWSRLGAYDAGLLDALLAPRREVFEYWSHAASILPMTDYAYYRPDMLNAEANLWVGTREWMRERPEVLRETLERVRANGPMASADFERPADGQRASAWDWYGPKESRRALEVLWTAGELMVHSRRGGQKVYDVRERVLAEAFGADVPRDDALPAPDERLRHFALRTVRALGVLTASWLWDYFRVRTDEIAAVFGARANSRTAARALLENLEREGMLVPATIEGIAEPAYLAAERVETLERLRAGETPGRTTLLSPFDNLIWHRARAEALFDYDVCFEAYVVPEKRRYGYYCLAILHRGRIVGRVDLKAARDEGVLRARTVYLEPGVRATKGLAAGLAGALRELARFLKLAAVRVERAEPEALAGMLTERVA